MSKDFQPASSIPVSGTGRATSRMPVEPGMPIGDGGGNGGGGGGGGCTPGDALVDFWLAVNPTAAFVPVGTVVTLSGGATVRHWHPNCDYNDQAEPVSIGLYYMAVGGGQPIDISTNLAGPPQSPQFTACFPGVYDIVAGSPPCPPTSRWARVMAGRGAVITGTAVAWVAVPALGCKRYATDPSGNPIAFYASLITPPDKMAASVFFNPIVTAKATITQSSPGVGTFDPATGAMTVTLHGNVQAAVSGTVDIVISTSATASACGNTALTGQPLDTAAQRMTLVGAAPVENLPDSLKADCWLEVNATSVQLFGF
jgi:hypothetical protein